MKKITAIFLIVAIASAGLILGCAKEDKKEIKIGAILPLTGPAAQFGQWKKEGIDMALDEINKAGGIDGSVIRMIYEDSQGDPKTGLAALRKLMTVEKTKIILSDLSGVTLSILPVTKKEILVITSAIHPRITGDEYLAIRNYVTPDQEASAMADFAKAKLGYEKVAILYLNDEAMRAYNDKFIEVFRELGGETLSEVYEGGATDFRTQLSKIKNWQPEAVYIIGWREIGSIMRQARELGIKARFLGPISFDSPMMLSLAGDAAEGAIYTVPAFGGPYETSEAAEFISKYETIYEREPEAITAIWYDQMYVLAYAFEQVGTGPANVFDAIIQKDSFSGTMGDFHFDESGSAVVKLAFKTIENGEFRWVQD